MLENLGQTIRQFRLQRGIGLNQMAEKIRVSSAYLSYLETSKTDNVNLKVLSEIISILNIPAENILNLEDQNEPSELSVLTRIELLTDKLKRLASSDPEGATLLVHQIESGIRLLERSKLRQHVDNELRH